MIKKRLNIRGETLAETIIALSILAMGIALASTVIMNSIRNLSNAKSRVIAINIAREGIEAVRSIRDSNWLYYSDKRRQCWNHDPSSVNPCDGVNLTPIIPGTYIVYKHDPEGSWRLQLADRNDAVDSDLDGDTENDLDLVPLSLVDIDSTVDSDNADDDDDDGTGNADDTDMYNHMDGDVNSPFGTEVKTTPYWRYVVIEYLSNDPDPLTAPSNLSPPEDSVNTEAEWNDGGHEPDKLNRMRITSVAIWHSRGIQYTAELKTILTDHLGREDLAS